MKKMLSLTLAVVIILGLMVPMSAFASNEITVTVNFDESLNQNQSKVITLPNLGEIKSITSSTGSVSHTVDGDNVTLNASGGAPSRSEQITVDKEGWLTETKTQSSQTFTDTVTKVNAKGEAVTLAKEGIPFVVSGSYVSSDSKVETQSQTNSTGIFVNTINYNQNGYVGTLSKDGSTTSVVTGGTFTPGDSKEVSITKYYPNISVAPNTIIYSENGYTGSISKTANTTYITTLVTPEGGSFSGTATITQIEYGVYPIAPMVGQVHGISDSRGFHFTGRLSSVFEISHDFRVSGGEFGVRTSTVNYVVNQIAHFQSPIYSGTITKPAVDTRIYSYTQNYSGTVTKPAVDTRIWGQNYKVWTVISQEQSTRNYYSYSMNVTYSLNYSVELGAINNELDSMKQQIISRQADDRLNEFLARNQVLMQNLNAMPNEPDVNIVKRKSLQLDKAILIMKSIINMEKGSITEDVFNTSNVINQIEDSTLKQQLQSQLSKVSDVSSIVRAIQKAETTFATGDIKKAMAVVKQLDNEHPQKANLVAQIEAIRNAFNDALTVKQKEAIKKDAIYFVAQTEQFSSVFYINRAKTLVEQLGIIDTTLQTELQERLTSVSGSVTSNSSFVESLAKRQLEMAEIHRHPALITQAQNSISLIKNEAVKADFMQRLELLK